MRVLLVCICCGVLNISFAQSPTYQALTKLNYNIDNNEFKLKGLSKYDEDFYWANIFFNYYKNPNMRGLMKADEDMIFSVGYEYLVCKNWSEDVDIDLSLKKKDKIQLLKVYQWNSKNSKLVSVKKKDINKVTTDSTVSIGISQGAIPLDSKIIVYCKLESFSFKELNLHIKPAFDGKKYISLNLPEVFEYSNSNLSSEPDELLNGSMVLKHFTYSSTPIVDYQVKTTSFKWQVYDLDQSFTLESINFPVFFGTTVERIISRGEE